VKTRAHLVTVRRERRSSYVERCVARVASNRSVSRPNLYREEGNETQARSLHQDALRRFRQLGLSHGVASCLHDLAALDAAGGRLAEAGVYTRNPCAFMDRRTRPIFPAAWSRWLTWRSNAGNRNARWRWPERQPRFGSDFTPARRIRRGAPRLKRRSILPVRTPERKAAALWMKGWNMSLDEIIEYAVEGGDDT